MKHRRLALVCRRVWTRGFLALLAAALTVTPFPLRPGVEAASGNRAAVTPGQATMLAETLNEYAIPTANSSPTNIINGLDGTFYFTETSGNKIGQFFPQNGAFIEYTLPTPNSRPYGIVLGPDLNLWLTLQGTHKIARMTRDGVVTEFPIPTPNCLPYGIEDGPDGALWFTENVGNKIGRITTAGVITEFPISTPNSGPLFIASDPSDTPSANLYFTEFNTGKIGKINLQGSITEFNPPILARGMRDLTIGLDGRVWYTHLLSTQMGAMDTSSGVFEVFPLNTGFSPNRIVPGTDGSLFVTGSASGKVLRKSGDSFQDTTLQRDAGPDGIAFLEDKATATGILAIVEGLGNKIAIDQFPLDNSLIEFTKTGPPNPVEAGHKLTYTFRIKNNSSRMVSFRIDDTVSPDVSLILQDGWHILQAGGPNLESTDIEFLFPSEEKQIPFSVETESPGRITNSAGLRLYEAYISAKPVISTVISGPVITHAAVEGKNLIVTGNFGSKSLNDANIVIDGVDHEKTHPDEANPTTTLIGKKAAKQKIERGETVKLQVRFADGTLTPEFSFTRPN